MWVKDTGSGKDGNCYFTQLASSPTLRTPKTQKTKPPERQRRLTFRILVCPAPQCQPLPAKSHTQQTPSNAEGLSHWPATDRYVFGEHESNSLYLSIEQTWSTIHRHKKGKEKSSYKGSSKGSWRINKQGFRKRHPIICSRCLP